MIKKILLLLLFFTLAASTAFAGAGNTVTGKVVIYTKDGKPKTDNSGVVVFVDMPAAASFQPPAIHPVISQKGKAFTPEVLPIVAGTVVDFPNDDDIFHNVFSVSKPKPFDLGIYEQNAVKQVTFETPGLVKIYCNIHPDMISYILVLSNPYFALTDKEGNFRIENIPDGDWTLRAWQRYGPEQEKQVALHGGSQVTADFTGLKEEKISIEVKEEKVSTKHQNKWGKDYPSKY